MKLRKLAAILLAAAITLCMFAVPASAAESKLSAPVIYYKQTDKGVDLYIDGITSKLIKQIRTETGVKKSKTSGFAIGCGIGSFDDRHLLLTAQMTNDMKSGKAEILDINGTDIKEIKGTKLKYYSKNKDGLTVGYRVSVTNEEAAAFILDRLYSSDITIYLLMKDDKEDLSHCHYFATSTGKMEIKPLPITKLGKVKLSSTVKSGKVMLTWEAVEGAQEYEIYVSTNGGKSYKKYDTVAASRKFALIKLDKDTKYVFRVRASATVNGKDIKGKLSNEVRA